MIKLSDVKVRPQNEGDSELTFVIAKVDHGTVGVEAVLAGRRPVQWRQDADRIIITVQLRAGDETNIRVVYASPKKPVAYQCSVREVSSNIGS
jgi:hypothetical protein